MHAYSTHIMASLRLLLPLSSSLLYYVVKIHHVHITVQCDALIKINHLPSLLHAVVRSVSLLLTTPAYQMSLVLTSAGTDGCILHVWLLVFNQAC